MDEHTQEMDHEKELLQAIAELTDTEKSQVIFGLLKEDPVGLDYLDSRKWAWQQFKRPQTAWGGRGQPIDRYRQSRPSES